MRYIAALSLLTILVFVGVLYRLLDTKSLNPGPSESSVSGSSAEDIITPVDLLDGDVDELVVQVLLTDGAPHTTSNIRAGDLVGEGDSQIFVSEPTRGQVVWLRDQDKPVIISDGLREPVRIHISDIDLDGDKDILVADIGTLWESDAKVGRVVLKRNNGDFDFSTEVLLEKVGRVACAESADFDNDGDIDLAVCVFGNTTGKIIWMEQKENFRFEEHILDARPGAIHAFPFDADGDSDIDLAVSLSQDYEEVLLFRNNGKGDFSKEILFNSDKIYFAMTGIELSDLDRDGDIDILVTNGDALNYYEIPDGVDPNNVHGLSWLENNGLGKFQYRDIIRIWGAYSVKPLDVDGDSDTDLVLSTMQLPEVFPRARLQGMIWLENDGEQDFFRHDIDLNVPSLTASIEIFDLDGDGSFEILGGTMDQSGGDAGHRLFSFKPLRSHD